MKQDDYSWFNQARYGMFIHWGLYSIPAGTWKGISYPHGAEWLMRNAQVPFNEYKKLKNEFNPRLFDADKWVKMAKEEFGVKYIVFTAKHHDGFAMYDSHASDYCITATPYKKDIVKMLSDACGKYGIVFCIYYSQMQDWAEPDGFGNTWDFGEEDKKNFKKYLDEKAKPQLRELLSNYGPIGLIWFDTPYEMKKEYCKELAEFVKSIQPKCLINGRIGYNLGDYRQMSDNSIPLNSYDGSWETPMTLNDTWGYRTEDENWKSPKKVIEMLTDVVGKGGNLLLNVGPDSAGLIPDGSVSVMRTVGAWLKVNGESIYDTIAAPDFPYRLNFGCFTYARKRKTLYMHVLKYPDAPYDIRVVGLKTTVLNARILNTGNLVRFEQSYESARDEHRLTVYLPEQNPDELDCVIELKLKEEPQVQSL